MEEDIHDHLASPLPSSKTRVKIEDKLNEAVDTAIERQSYDMAHNEDMLDVLSLVASFIQRKKRVCYGGTAMNAILPESLRFYSADKDLPDYDFYTPSLEEDVAALVADLKAAGYKDVHHKVGIHEGTKKIMVNYMPVADISAIESDLFTILFRRSILKDGIHYTDPDVLRMMMYLEMSRPKGMVSRWSKVFERLQLINKAFPIRGCGMGAARGAARGGSHTIPQEIRKGILEFIIENQRVLCNGGMNKLYEAGIRNGSVKFDISRPGPAVLFISPDPRADAVALKAQLERSDIRMFLHKARGEIVPERVELRAGNQPICLLIKESACHAINNIPLKDGRVISVGNLEFLITLYLSLDIFTTHSKDVIGERVLCDVADFIRLSGENYKARYSMFPAFSLTCRGHQAGFASLLRAKALRIQHERRAMGSTVPKRKTRKMRGAIAKKGGRVHRGSHTRSKK